ncbi:MAG TPA: nuclear transport factor 2 family protein [Candidatus Deferrimicrobiaceae bacterium]|nr:nuclear transport factor 2 family protein [Candidatus Deferrimicrobiaceae bacterium]
MTHAEVQAWLNRYVEAWFAYDAIRIGELFSADAEYRYHPQDEPLRGRDAIVADWLNPGGDPAGRDAPGTVEGRYEPFAVDGARAVAIGTTTYWADATRATVEHRYYNSWLLEFDADGRCRSFTEYFMRPRKGTA